MFRRELREVQDLSDTPGLGDRSARIMRLVSVKDFGNLANSCIAKMCFKDFEPLIDFIRRSVGEFADGKSGRKERTQKPRPNRTLVVGTVVTRYISLISSFVAMVARGERSESERH
jgi:hypothetical protein